MNPATALARVLVDELARCGLRDAVLAPGSRSAPLAMALHAAQPDISPPDISPPGISPPDISPPGIRLHVRLDERSAAFLALGLARASGRPAAVLCTSGTAAAHLHAAVIEADESAVPLLVLTADRPPELRGTGASQAIDQIRLYGTAVRWFCEVGTPEADAASPAGARYWRSMACRAWATAAGSAGGLPGPVHLNLAFRDPLVPDADGGWDTAGRPGGAPWTRFWSAPPTTSSHAGAPGTSIRNGAAPGQAPATTGTGEGTDQPAAGPPPRPAAEARGTPDRPANGGGGPQGHQARAAGGGMPGRAVGAAGIGVRARQVGAAAGGALELPWTERGVIVAGDGAADPAGLAALAEAAGWPLLAEPSSGARHGRAALGRYSYLLATPEFVAAHRPDVIISAGRPGLSRPQLALLRASAGRHVVLAQGPGRWADPARTATDVAPAIRLTAGPDGASPGAVGHESGWLASWRAADAAAGAAAGRLLDSGDELTEPRLAAEVAALLPDGALLWAASSLPIRDLDQQAAPRAGLLVTSNRGASGIDGLVSCAIGAALAHQAAGGGRAAALLGDLALLHDSAGLFLGPGEPRPDLCLIVVNNDGGGIFSQLEQAAFPDSFERVFGTPHGAAVDHLATAAGLPYERVTAAAALPAALAGPGLRLVEVRTSRAAGTRLRAELGRACAAAVRATLADPVRPA